MVAFHVYVEGPTEATPQGVRKLADAIAARYGLPATELVSRLSKGRFRVKANVDHETAQTYLRDLQQIGARVTVEDATPGAPRTTTGSALPPPRTTTGSALPPPAAPRTMTGALPPRTTTGSAVPSPAAPRTTTGSALPPAASSRPAVGRANTPAHVPIAPIAPRTATGNQQFASGLSAAFSGPGDQMESSSLGALEYGDTALSLASLDGEDSTSAAGTFEPPGQPMLPASIGPATAPAPAARPKPAQPSDGPIDLFAPPGADAPDAKLDFAIEGFAQPDASPPLPALPPPPSTRPSSARLERPAALPAEAPTNRLGPLGEPRVRFAAGVVLAILLGFIPAHLIAATRERSSAHAIATKLAGIVETATPDEAEQAWHVAVADTRSAQRNIALMSMLIWAAVGGALGYVWFRRIPWDRPAG